jgi:hypothetical protein
MNDMTVRDPPLRVYDAVAFVVCDRSPALLRGGTDALRVHFSTRPQDDILLPPFHRPTHRGVTRRRIIGFGWQRN